MSIPILPDHDAKGVKIPYFDAQGRLQMVFNIGVATRLDADHLKMTETQVETFDDEGASEMLINLPTSTLDLNTRVITSETTVTIRRDDFEITGHTLEFNTITKQGALGGDVQMFIYNLNEESPPKPAPDAPNAEDKTRE